MALLDKHCIINVSIPIEKSENKWLKNIYDSVMDDGDLYDYSFVYNYNLSSINIIDIDFFTEL